MALLDNKSGISDSTTSILIDTALPAINTGKLYAKFSQLSGQFATKCLKGPHDLRVSR